MDKILFSEHSPTALGTPRERPFPALRRLKLLNRLQ